MGTNVLVTPQLGTLTATPQLPEFRVQTNKQNSEDEKLRDDEPGQLPHAGGPDLGQVLPGREEQQQVCGRRQFLQMRRVLRKPHTKEKSHLDRSSSRRSEESHLVSGDVCSIVSTGIRTQDLRVGRPVLYPL